MFETDSLKALLAWAETLPLWWIVGGVSLASMLLSVLAIPWIIVRIPAEYFAAEDRQSVGWGGQKNWHVAVLVVGKNVFGAVLCLAGLALLVLPGQGLLTILIGLGLMNFPGKYRLEKWLVQRRQVLRSLNWIRHRFGVAPLRISTSHVKG